MSRYSMRKSDQKTQSEAAVKQSVKVSDLVQVTKFDPERLTVDVQPLVKADIDASYESQRPIVNVPVMCLTFGRFTVRPWYEPGEIGVILYNDSDTDNALSGGSETEPNTPRNHAPEDGKFIGGIKADSMPLPAGIPDEALVLCNQAGDVFFAIMDAEIKSKGEWNHEGDVNIEGNVTVKGNVTVTGGDVVADGISLKRHTHPGCQGGTRGQPQ